MKKILFFSCVVSLLSATGCLVSEGGGGHYHGHGHFESHSEIIVHAPPPVYLRAPTVYLRPPEIIVH